MNLTYEVIIIGGGQAGLAMAYALKQKNIQYVVLDENELPGASWKKRYDSLTLFTPRKYSTLFEYPLEGDPNSFPRKDELAVYLRNFANENELTIKHNEKVIRVTKDRSLFRVETQTQILIANQVVVATGAFYDPFIPAIHDDSIPFMIHSSAYKNPNQVPKGKVLVVGSGNTGVQIAAELSQSHEVVLSSSHKVKNIPTNILGKSLFWWLEFLRISKAKPESMIGRLLQRRDPIIGEDYKQVKQEVTQVSRLKSVEQGTCYFEKHQAHEVHSIIWATGYKNRYDWIQMEGVVDSDGKPIHKIGQSNVKGLYFLGLSWQSRRSSALIYGVENDAKYVAQLVVKNRTS